MNFRASFCDPFNPNVIEIDNIAQDKIIEAFHNIPWADCLEQMKNAKESQIYYSPSLEIENIDNKNGISVSAIDGTEWYIFYKRPKLVKRFFGLSKKMNDHYLTEIQGQSQQDVLDCLMAIVKNDLDFLERKVK